jgi:ABC-type transport system involved in cytochrome c biogenesis permease subunit
VADQLHRLPVQHDGRAMPFETLALESVTKVSGACQVSPADPVRYALGWYYDAAGWSDVQNVQVGGSDLAAALGLAPSTRCASFNSLVANPKLQQVLHDASNAPDKGKPKMLRDAEELAKRLELLDSFYVQKSLRVTPTADPMGTWLPPSSLRAPDTLVQVLNAPPKGVAHYPTAAEIDRELLYNAARPARLAWLILVPAAIFAALSLRRPKRALDLLGIWGLAGGFAAMSWGIWMRWQIAGRVPASNMYESLLFLGWGVGLFAVVASIFLKNRMVIFNAAAMAAVTMLLVDLLPMDGFIHPVAPVLAGTVWLAIHVPIIMVSYSVLTLGVLVAHMQIGVTIFSKTPGDFARKLYDLLYWYILIGSILLIAGILTGSVWAASSWGRYWGWDPKEVWSLIAFLAYMAILHGRFDRFIGPFGVAAYSIGAFWTILMTYLGVNYILAAGMHSYGFGGSDVVTWMVGSGVVEIAFLTAGFTVRHRFKG